MIQDSERLDVYCSNRFFLSRSQARKLIENGQILVNKKVEKPSYKLKEEDTVEFTGEKKEDRKILPQNIPLDIIYEDDYLIVLNKQKGLLTHPTTHNYDNTLVNALLYHTKGKLSNIGGDFRQGIVHRLDCDTSGLMLAAKTNFAHEKLAEDIKTKKTVRKYLGICHGIIEDDFGIIDKPLVHYMGKTVKMNVSNEGQKAITEYKVLERFQKATFLELKLQTGRTHQIRCHLSSLNHPLIGDILYGSKGFIDFQNLKTKGQVLQSYFLAFTHPVTGEIMEYRIDYDEDIKKVLNYLRSK